MKFGKIGHGLFVRHSCDNPPCVNVDHLSVGTAQQNSDDMMRRGRQAAHNHFGAFNPNATIDSGAAIKIKNLYASGKHTQKQLSKMFGIGQSQVSRIILGHAWGGGR
jgi:predicted XRE-type DNA-binding protein